MRLGSLACFPLAFLFAAHSFAFTPQIDSITPTEVLYSAGAVLTIRGSAFTPAIESVTLSDETSSVPAIGASFVDPSTIVALFSPFPSSAVGDKTVTVAFGDGTRASLPKRFKIKFDQDPVVFVHGCPLPKETFNGSGTNYVTSKYWFRLYALLRNEHGYPAPQWKDEDDFLHNFKHRSTRPASNNYLNVFVLSEDTHDPSQIGTASDPQAAGRCGSGLLLAHELAAFVDEVIAKTGMPKVDLVVNSAGALGARYYVRYLSGLAKVRDVVFLAAMNHGTEAALVPAADQETFDKPNYEGAREGFPAYACDGEAYSATTSVGEHNGADLQYLVNGCIRYADRDSAFEIPGDHRKHGENGVAYLSILNAVFDELIEPTVSACLNQRFIGDCVDPINVPVHAQDSTNPAELPHQSIRLDPEVLALTSCHLRARNAVKPQSSDSCEEERTAAMVPLPSN